MDSTYAASYPELYRDHWWWRVREGILLDKLNALLRHKTRPARILDVGCGAGLFFDALQPLGRVDGIESDLAAVNSAGKWRERIYHGELDDSFEPTEPYDVILMLDVLEHINDPQQLLHCARKLLTPEGLVVITVPAFNWLWTAHDDLNHHVCRYTKAQMLKQVTASGLVATESTYLFQSLVFPKAVVGLQEWLLSTPAAVPTIPADFLNAALRSWFRVEYALARWLPFGTSLMMIARSAPQHDVTHTR